MSDPVLPSVHMNLVRPRQAVAARLVESRPCLRGRSSSFVRHLSFDLSGTPLEGAFLAGQAIGVVADGTTDRGAPHAVRLYSIACPRWGEDGEGKIISTTCKRLIDEHVGEEIDDHSLFLGGCSNFLCDAKIGDTIMVTGPSGKRFLLPENPEQHDYVMVATGTGIAPFRGMILELLEHPDGPRNVEIHLVAGVPYGTDLMYHDLFEKLAETHARFHYHTVVSRPDHGPRQYVDGFIRDAADPLHEVLKRPQSLLYLCGIEGMQIGIYRLLDELSVADDYLIMPEDSNGLAGAEAAAIKRLRPRGRCMVEVY